MAGVASQEVEALAVTEGAYSEVVVAATEDLEASDNLAASAVAAVTSEEAGASAVALAAA